MVLNDLIRHIRYALHFSQTPRCTVIRVTNQVGDRQLGDKDNQLGDTFWSTERHMFEQ